MQNNLEIDTHVAQLRYKYSHSQVNRVYFLKFIEFGNFIDVTNYKRLRLSFKNKNKINVRKKTDRLDRSLQRTRENIYRLIEANIKQHGNFRPVFATLTYAHNVKDLSPAYRDFKYFIKKLKEKLGKKVHYVAVPEFQKRGAVHFHIVFLNLPYIKAKDFENLWGLGMTNIQVAKKIGSTSKYLFKYLTKSLLDKRLSNRRIVLSSRGLYRPVQSFSHEDLSSKLNNGTYTIVSAFETEFIKKSKYQKNDNS